MCLVRSEDSTLCQVSSQVKQPSTGVACLSPCVERGSSEPRRRFHNVGFSFRSHPNAVDILHVKRASLQSYLISRAEGPISYPVDLQSCSGDNSRISQSRLLRLPLPTISFHCSNPRAPQGAPERHYHGHGSTDEYHYVGFTTFSALESSPPPTSRARS